MASWLKDAVFYEIYPQTFKDSNADGIGDFNGITEKLDYIKDLGCNAIWMNPCFDSPFKDAGYDVRDYKKVAARYGTEEDLIRLFEEVHKRDMHIFLDLVPGHTSEEHPWFLESKKLEKNEFTDRYIWTDFWLEGGDGLNFIAGETERNSAYILNFFKCQPALNYGFYAPKKKWQKHISDPACLATRNAMVDVMDFWLSKGCDGFRIDMADSLAKYDEDGKKGTIEIWQDMLGRMHKKYPEAAFVSEWGRPWESIPAGFDMDFLLNWSGKGYSTLFRDYGNHADDGLEGSDFSYFRKGSNGTIDAFIDEYLDTYGKVKGAGSIALITGNHDTPRISYKLSQDELKIGYAFLLTMPGNPFIYYGDEIGMKYIPDMKTKEGGYTRTGSRTPMQWNKTANKGFSTGSEELLYLPVDNSQDAPDVESQLNNEDSLLNLVKAVLKLRHSKEDLKDNTNFELLSREPFVYKRGNLIMAVNPSEKDKSFSLPNESELVFLVENGHLIKLDETVSKEEQYINKDDIDKNLTIVALDKKNYSDDVKIGQQSFAIFEIK